MLQRQVDDLDDLKASHYQEIIEHEEEVWDVVQGKVSPAPHVGVSPANKYTRSRFALPFAQLWTFLTG